jgi:hypothetical protein
MPRITPCRKPIVALQLLQSDGAPPERHHRSKMGPDLGDRQEMAFLGRWRGGGVVESGHGAVGGGTPGLDLGLRLV